MKPTLTLFVVFASDHLNQWFMDNMPPFLIGKARFAKGPFPHESKAHGLREYRAEIGGELARVLLRDGLDRGVLRSLESEGFWNTLKR